MKKTIYRLVAVLAIMGLTACGNDTRTSGEVMVLNQAYTLEINEQINKITDDAKIQIMQNSEEGERYYTLLEGEAMIVQSMD
ncbi:MAG: hypothetical protein ABFQ64_08470 [Campylobacterota bacterium]